MAPISSNPRLTGSYVLFLVPSYIFQGRLNRGHDSVLVALAHLFPGGPLQPRSLMLAPLRMMYRALSSAPVCCRASPRRTCRVLVSYVKLLHTTQEDLKGCVSHGWLQRVLTEQDICRSTTSLHPSHAPLVSSATQPQIITSCLLFPSRAGKTLWNITHHSNPGSQPQLSFTFSPIIRHAIIPRIITIQCAE